MRRRFFIERFFDHSADIFNEPTRKYLYVDNDTALPRRLLFGGVILYYFMFA
jgi:hypothetical protein